MRNRVSGMVVAIATALSRIIAAGSLIKAVVVNLATVRRKQAILLMSDGGFGHTITGPDWLRRLHPGMDTMTFFAAIYGDARHNRLISNLWGDGHFIWVRKGIALPYLGSFHDPVWIGKLFRTLQRFFAWYRPNTPCYCSIEDLVAASPRPAWLGADDQFNLRYESRYYPLIQAIPAPALHVSELMHTQISRLLKNRFGTDFKRRCAFYIRYQATTHGSDSSSLNRLSAPLDAYLPAIQMLNGAGFQVLLTGDVLAHSRIVADMAGGIVDWRSAGIDQNAFKVFAGTEVDIHIGSLSGGSAFVFATDIPALMLNAFPPGDGLPRTTVYYKWLFQKNGKALRLEDLLGGMFFDHQLHDCDLVENAPEEMAEAVDDFIRNYEHARPYGVNPADIGISAPWLRAADARLSPVWLKYYQERTTVAAVRRVVA